MVLIEWWQSQERIGGLSYDRGLRGSISMIARRLTQMSVWQLFRKNLDGSPTLYIAIKPGSKALIL
jgi:hypothetical protein